MVQASRRCMHRVKREACSTTGQKEREMVTMRLEKVAKSTQLSFCSRVCLAYPSQKGKQNLSLSGIRTALRCRILLFEIKQRHCRPLSAAEGRLITTRQSIAETHLAGWHHYPPKNQGSCMQRVKFGGFVKHHSVVQETAPDTEQCSLTQDSWLY